MDMRDEEEIRFENALRLAKILIQRNKAEEELAYHIYMGWKKSKNQEKEDMKFMTQLNGHLQKIEEIYVPLQ